MKARVQFSDPNRRMNKSEAKYANEVLEMEKRAGLIQDYVYGSVKLRLADNTWYTPDFMVIDAQGYVWFLEYKGGWWRDDARVKIKVAAEEYPMFKFVSVTSQPKKKGGGYKREEFS